MLAESAGASLFDSLLRELSLSEPLEARVNERLRLGLGQPPSLADGLVEFTSQPGLSSSLGGLGGGLPGGGGGPLALGGGVGVVLPTRSGSAGRRCGFT